MKKHVFKLIYVLSMVAFSIGFHPTCWATNYQPELPDELK